MDRAWWVLAVALVALIAAAVWLWFRRRFGERPQDTFWLGGGDTQAPPLPPLSARGSLPLRRDKVEASALVPEAAVPGQVCRIEVVLARRTDMARALARFGAGREPLVAAPRRALTAWLVRESVLELTLECAQAELITPRRQRLVWSGAALSAGFQLRPAAAVEGEVLLVDVNVFVDRVCVGHLPLALPIADRAGSALAPARARFEVPRRVFMSYTGADRAQVLPIARALRQLGVETFMDRLSIEGGEDWEQRLHTEIDACDCFMLFWSQAAAASLWVQREALRALERQRASPQRRPKIVTHLLGKPPPAPPPPALAALHFNDPAYALWEMAVAESRA